MLVRFPVLGTGFCEDGGLLAVSKGAGVSRKGTFLHLLRPPKTEESRQEKGTFWHAFRKKSCGNEPFFGSGKPGKGSEIVWNRRKRPFSGTFSHFLTVFGHFLAFLGENGEIQTVKNTCNHKELECVPTAPFGAAVV